MNEETSANNNSNIPADPAVEKKPMPKGLKIIIIIGVVLVVLFYGISFLLGTFGVFVAKEALRQNGVEIKTGMGGDQANVTIKKDGAEMNIGANATLPTDFPSDVPVYKAQIVSNITSLENGKKVYAVTMKSEDKVSVISDFYKKELAAQSWKVTQDMTMNENYHMLAAEKDDRVASILIVGDDKGMESSITLSVGVK